MVNFFITELLTFLFLIIIQENRTEQGAFSNLWSSESRKATNTVSSPYQISFTQHLHVYTGFYSK